MKYFTLEKRFFAEGEIKNAVKIATRMGWMPEEDSDTFTVAVPEEDLPLFDFIFDYFM